MWDPPDHQTQSKIKQDNFKLMRERLVEQLSDVDRHDIVLHVNAWADQWKRHWLGGIAEWIDDATGQRQSRLVCFEKLDAWADPIEGISAHQAQTSATAVRASWSTSLGLGE